MVKVIFIISELEKIDRRHAQLTRISTELVDALNLYHQLMHEVPPGAAAAGGGAAYGMPPAGPVAPGGYPGYGAPQHMMPPHQQQVKPCNQNHLIIIIHSIIYPYKVVS